MNHQHPTVLDTLWTAISRDFRQLVRQPREIIQPLIFLLLTVSLFPLGVGPEPAILQTIAPGIIWVTALLSTLLGMDRLFRQEIQQGTLDLLLLSPHPLALLVLGKIIVHWLVTGLPLVIVAPLLAIWLNLSSQALHTLILTLLLATPSLSLMGAIGTALTSGVRQNPLLLTLLILPLYIPVLIFSAGAVSMANQGLPASGQLAILGAILALALPLAPIASAAALKITSE